ncbi:MULTISPECIES: NUDIX domain-containing protein [Actinomadura]|uniref:NUDIX domain-containing protein n=1 Tax=Actinomadura yumaensis TaxID=111807 RepID=A0ABW2CCK1_9ACTN
MNLAVTNDHALLVIRRADNGSWALPGGAIDHGESVAQAASATAASDRDGGGPTSRTR